MSLAAAQAKAMQDTWGRFRDNREKIGVTVFQKLFTNRPDILQFFPKFSSVAVGSMPSNADFQKQVKLVVDRFDTIVSSCDNAGALGGHFSALGSTHKNYKVTRDHLNAFAKDFVAVMLENGISADEKAVCEQVLNAVIDGVVSNMN